MTMDWVSWLRDGVLPSTEQEYSGDRPFGASQAELLGLPVAVVVLPDDSVPVAPLQEESPEPGPLPEDIVQPDSPGKELETPLAPETELEIFEDAADYPDTAADDEQRPEEVTVAEEEVPAIPGSEPERELPPEQATRPEELQPDEAWPDERQYEQVEEILFEKEKPVSAFTIPARPLYPVPVSSKEPEKRLLAADEGPVGKKKSLAFLLVATIAIVAGLFFLPGESYEELLARADSAFQEEQYEEALLNYDKASGKSPLQVESLRRKALALEALDRKGEAVDAWYGCLQATPDSAEIHSHLGELFFSLGSLDKAHKSFQESIGLDPGEASPYFGLGTVYEAKGEIEKASEAFAKAHQIEPDRKDYEEARSRLQREIDAREEELRLQDTMAEQQLVMGIASLVAKEYDDAEAHFTRALDLVPREKRAMLGLAESKAAKGDLPGARIAYLEILDEYPDDAGAMEGLASLEAGEKEPLAADDQEKASSEDDVVKESPLADPAEEKHADAADTTEESPVETEITDDALVAEKEDDLLVPTTPPGETVDAIKAQKPADQPKIAVKTEQPQKEKEQAPIDRPARPEKPVTVETPVTKLPATQERKKPSPPPPPLARDVGPSEVQSLRKAARST
ncbi:MAG: tetratricopeptide repeat protein [Synergistaceae bacterium]|nr:tetratricopeptide repeat protein [Synergistaceae bacterium]